MQLEGLSKLKKNLTSLVSGETVKADLKEG
jgi:hypothetical protein